MCRNQLIIIVEINMKRFIQGFLLLAGICTVGSVVPDSRHPIIGVYTAPPEKSNPINTPATHSYIPASYVKHLEMAGAQVVPIFYSSSEQQLEYILSQLNGVVITGAGLHIDISNQWTKNLKFIMEYAMQQNREGNPYPIWSVCLGIQAMMYLTSGQTITQAVISKIPKQNGIVRPLKIYEENSQLVRIFNTEEYQAATTGEGIFFFHHKQGVLKSTFDQNQALRGFWNVVATGISLLNVEFLALVEAKQFPFFALQFHPQKSNFEWRVGAPRTYTAIQSSQKLINHFVNIARKNKNSFISQEQLKNRLIYNHQAIYLSLKLKSHMFLQIYDFDESDFERNPYGYSLAYEKQA